MGVKGKDNGRRRVSSEVERMIWAFFGRGKCICGCDDCKAYHHLNDIPSDSDRIENILPIDHNLNWTAFQARKGAIVPEVRVAIARLEERVVKLQWKERTVWAYPHAYGCNRMLAYFAEQEGDSERELRFLVGCLRDLNRTRDCESGALSVRNILLLSVVARCIFLFSKDQVSNLIRAHLLDSLGNIVHDGCFLNMHQNLERVRLLRKKASLFRKRYERDNKHPVDSRGLELAHAANLRRAGHADVIVGNKKVRDSGCSMLRDALIIFDRLSDDEGYANVVFSLSVGAYVRSGAPNKALKILEQLPKAALQNPWNAAPSLCFRARMEEMAALKPSAKKKARNRLTEGEAYYKDWNLPVPRTTIQDAEFLLGASRTSNQSSGTASPTTIGFNKPLSLSILDAVDLFLKSNPLPH